MLLTSPGETEQALLQHSFEDQKLSFTDTDVRATEGQHMLKELTEPLSLLETSSAKAAHGCPQAWKQSVGRLSAARVRITFCTAVGNVQAAVSTPELRGGRCVPAVPSVDGLHPGAALGRPARGLGLA